MPNMRFSRLEDWLQWMETLHPRDIDLGLKRSAAVATKLAISLEPPVITVAGTNGKGSCVAILSAILAAQGYRVGSYTSPHLLRFNERIVIAGKTVSDTALCQALAEVDSARGDISLTYFEFTTLAALCLFQSAAMDVVVLEVGLGGRLDAVNIIDADVAIVSSIALDHEAWLGSDREVIGIEKAGIFRQGRPAVIGDLSPPQSLLNYANQLGCRVLCREKSFSFTHHGETWDWHGVDLNGSPCAYLQLPMPKLLLDNAATVLQALQCLSLAVSESAIREGLSQAEVTGRCQHAMVTEVDIVMDVAHNPAAVVTLREHLRQNSVSGRTLCVFAVMADKAIATMILELSDCFSGWLLADLPTNPRAAKAADVADLLVSQGLRALAVGGTVDENITQALTQLSSGDRLVIFGSFFTVSEALPRVFESPEALPTGSQDLKF
jgi:dihydrofolate synthase/folylpolyglutamate synthase